MPRTRITVGSVVAAVALLSSCSDDSAAPASGMASDGLGDETAAAPGGEQPEISETGVSLVERSTTTLPSCVAEPIDPPAGWPITLPAAMAAEQFERSGTRFVASGITADPEAAIVAAMDVTFDSFDVDEPGGGERLVELEFEGDNGSAWVVLDDADDDGCWAAEFGVEYVDVPSSATEIPDAFLTPGADPSEGPGSDDRDTDGQVGDNGDDETSAPVTTVDDDFDRFEDVVAVGRGEIVTGRGTFPFAFRTVWPRELLGVQQRRRRTRHRVGRR